MSGIHNNSCSTVRCRQTDRRTDEWVAKGRDNADAGTAEGRQSVYRMYTLRECEYPATQSVQRHKHHSQSLDDVTRVASVCPADLTIT